jgi:hypothetical protein
LREVFRRIYQDLSRAAVFVASQIQRLCKETKITRAVIVKQIARNPTRRHYQITSGAGLGVIMDNKDLFVIGAEFKELKYDGVSIFFQVYHLRM